MRMGKTVLIVEDDAAMRTALAAHLSHETFTILEAQDGAEGLSLALEKKPDLILLDLMMPVKDGMEMLRELRMDPWGKEARVMLLTNVKDTEKVADALALSVFRYFVKSDNTLDEITSAIRGELSGS